MNNEEKTEKPFDVWNEDKKSIHSSDGKRIFFHEREIWFCRLGLNVGFEQDGRGDDFLRPVIILKKFNNQVCWCIPLTKTKKKNKYYTHFSFEDNEVSVAILSQIRLIDAKRLQYKIGYVPKKDFEEIKKSLRQFLT